MLFRSLKGDSSWFVQQLTAVGASIGVAVVGTVVIFAILKLLFRSLNVTNEEETLGLDITQHGESGYVSVDN